MNDLIGPGDFNTDWRNDLLARKASHGSLWLYQGAGGGRFATPTQLGHGWNTFDRPSGRETSTGRVGRSGGPATQRIDVSLSGNGVGRFRTPTKIGTRWAEFDLLI